MELPFTKKMKTCPLCGDKLERKITLKTYWGVEWVCDCGHKEDYNPLD